MNNHLTPSVRLVLTACLLLLGSGCASFQKPVFGQGKGANGSEILLVPFGEPGKRIWYGESHRGRQLVKLLEAWAFSNALDPQLAQGEQVTQVIESVEEWEKQRIRSRDWQMLTRGLGVKYVVVGDILEFTLKSPKMIGIYSAHARARYSVVNAITGKVALRPRDATATYGRGREIMDSISVTTTFDNDRYVENELLGRLAEQIGKELYGYERD